jgi:2-oxoglutarate ferredoxin oxidoreductase subunit gamma
MSESRWPVAIRFGGLGGQGLVTLGAVLAQAGAFAGLSVAASQSYGSRARGGATRSDVILSAEAIDFPHVHNPDLLVVLAQEAHELFASEVAAGGLILADGFFVSSDAPAGIRQQTVDATNLAMERVGNKIAANFIMLGALLGFTELLEKEPLEEALEQIVRARFVAANKKALAVGWGLGLDLRSGEGGPWR